MHRSPPIEGTGVTRLVLVLDVVDGPEDAKHEGQSRRHLLAPPGARQAIRCGPTTRCRRNCALDRTGRAALVAPLLRAAVGEGPSGRA